VVSKLHETFQSVAEMSEREKEADVLSTQASSEDEIEQELIREKVNTWSLSHEVACFNQSKKARSFPEEEGEVCQKKIRWTKWNYVYRC